MRNWRVVLAAVVVAGGVLVVGASPGVAACHAFTIDVSPASVAEGASVTVTVERDAAVADSSIDVKSVDETAKAGGDYTAVNRKISFTGSSTQQTFNVATTNDAAAEASETFRLEMSNPGGCAVNPNFDFDDTATVTIADNDQVAPAPTTAKPIASPTTKAAQTTTTAAAATTTSESSTSTTDTTTTDATVALEDEDDDGGSPAAAIALGVAALGVAGAIGYVVYRRRAMGV